MFHTKKNLHGFLVQIFQYLLDLDCIGGTSHWRLGTRPVTPRGRTGDKATDGGTLLDSILLPYGTENGRDGSDLEICSVSVLVYRCSHTVQYCKNILGKTCSTGFHLYYANYDNMFSHSQSTRTVKTSTVNRKSVLQLYSQ